MSQAWNGTKKESPERRIYTVEDITQILGIGRTSAYLLVKEGHFKIVRIGNAIRISKRSFDEWLESLDLWLRKEVSLWVRLSNGKRINPSSTTIRMKMVRPGRNGKPAPLTRTHWNARLRWNTSSSQGPSFRPATRPSQNFFWTLVLCMGKRSGAYPCMTAKTRWSPTTSTPLLEFWRSRRSHRE